MRLILASSSPRRHDLLTSLGLTFDVIKPQIDEAQRPGEDPYLYVERMSAEKAHAVVGMIDVDDPAVVLAADTVVLAADTIGVESDGALLGKPTDADDARAMLRRLRGVDHIVCTAVHVRRVGHAPAGYAMQVAERCATRVTMRDYTDDEIEAYIATGDPFDKAGSYAIQHPGFRPVTALDGCYDTVVGLPLCAVKRTLFAVGYPAIDAPGRCTCADDPGGYSG